MGIATIITVFSFHAARSQWTVFIYKYGCICKKLRIKIVYTELRVKSYVVFV